MQPDLKRAGIFFYQLVERQVKFFLIPIPDDDTYLLYFLRGFDIQEENRIFKLFAGG